MYKNIKNSTTQIEFDTLVLNFPQNILDLVESEIIELGSSDGVIGKALGYVKEVALNEINNEELTVFVNEKIRIAENGTKSTYLLTEEFENILPNEIENILRYEYDNNANKFYQSTSWFIKFLLNPTDNQLVKSL